MSFDNFPEKNMNSAKNLLILNIMIWTIVHYVNMDEKSEILSIFNVKNM